LFGNDAARLDKEKLSPQDSQTIVNNPNRKAETMNVQLSTAGISALRHIHCMYVPDIPNVADEPYILLMADGICMWTSPRELAPVLFPEETK